MNPRALLLLAATLAAAPPAAAQLCRGVPMRAVALMGHEAEGGTRTAEGVIGLGKTYLGGNYAWGDAGASNGSTLSSYGGRLYYAGARTGRNSNGGPPGGFGMCVVAGLQMAYAHLLNAEGLLANARITETQIPVGVGFGVGFGGRAARVTLFAMPQYIFRSGDIELYDRADTASTPLTGGSTFALDLGASLLLGPVLVRGTYLKQEDREWSWRLGAGLAW